jgi:GT2 family glycosyltransferase
MDPKIAIIISSYRRPVELGRWIDHVERQSLRPCQMIWAVTNEVDLPALPANSSSFPPVIVRSERGSSAQRNRALDRVWPEAEIIAFFDDDYVPSSDCLREIARIFQQMPNVVGLTGHLLADGINSHGIAYEEAMVIVQEYDQRKPVTDDSLSFAATEGLYGCNMAYRANSIRDIRFDERLPMYAWQEDSDFAAQVSRKGNIGSTKAFAGVHQGVKGGRTSGTRLGYSQIANPVYLYRKGTMSLRKALTLTVKNLLANHLRSLAPEPWTDRRGRVAGNWLALADLVRGTSDPEKILTL